MMFQVFLLAFIAFAASRAVRQFRRGVSGRREVLFWIALWCAAAVVVAWPEFLSRVAGAVHIGRGVDVATYTALVLLFYLLFRIVGRLDRIEQDITRIVSSKALLHPESDTHDDSH